MLWKKYSFADNIDSREESIVWQSHVFSRKERLNGKKMNNLDWILGQDKKFRYQLLDSIRANCDYYLGNGNRNVYQLWATNETEQIAYMKAIWNSFSEDEKPEWLTWEDISNYESEMVSQLGSSNADLAAEKENSMFNIVEI